jgi:hypothetical protein
MLIQHLCPAAGPDTPHRISSPPSRLPSSNRHPRPCHPHRQPARDRQQETDFLVVLGLPTVALDRAPVPAAVWTDATGNVAVAPFQAAPGGHPLIGTVTPSALPLASNGFPTLEDWGVRKDTWVVVHGWGRRVWHPCSSSARPDLRPSAFPFFDPTLEGILEKLAASPAGEHHPPIVKF